MLMATAAPSLLVGLFAGVLVDRFNRKAIMIASDLLRAVLVFLIPFLVPHNIIWLYVIVLVSSAIGQFFDPAHESVLPEVASEQELAAANSLMAISSFGATAVGFAASGLIAGCNGYPLGVFPGCGLVRVFGGLHFPDPHQTAAGGRGDQRGRGGKEPEGRPAPAFRYTHPALPVHIPGAHPGGIWPVECPAAAVRRAGAQSHHL